MDKKTRKKLIGIVASALTFAVMAAGTVILTKSVNPAQAIAVFSHSNTNATASISPTVTDAETGEPIEGAVIIIPEADGEFVTDKNGSAGTLNMPVISDERYKKILPRPWGEVSILVYADGYAPCAVLNYMVKNGVERTGPEIMLFKDDPSSSAYSLCEPPHKEWVDALIEKYRP